MPRLRKLLFDKSVVFITTTVEEGLPFAANPLMKALIESAIGRALMLHPIRICHHLFESNHVHMIALVDDPKNLKGFMERFKTETAHAVNRLLGKKKRTVWCERYDSPILLTVEDVVSRIVYIYTNPAKDNLEDSIEKYPGISSWRPFRNGKQRKDCAWIRREEIFPLPSTSLSLKQYEGLTRRLKSRATVEHPFTIHPNAWMEAFGITEPKEQEELNEEIVRQVREKEEVFRRERVEEGKSVIGAERLILQPIDTPYVPDRSGRKMWCISSDIELRKGFISMIKELVSKAQEVCARWAAGEYLTPFPAFPGGLYPPAMLHMATSLPLSFEC